MVQVRGKGKTRQSSPAVKKWTSSPGLTVLARVWPVRCPGFRWSRAGILTEPGVEGDSGAQMFTEPLEAVLVLTLVVCD